MAQKVRLTNGTTITWVMRIIVVHLNRIASNGWKVNLNQFKFNHFRCTKSCSGMVREKFGLLFTKKFEWCTDRQPIQNVLMKCARFGLFGLSISSGFKQPKSIAMIHIHGNENVALVTCSQFKMLSPNKARLQMQLRMHTIRRETLDVAFRCYCFQPTKCESKSVIQFE